MSRFCEDNNKTIYEVYMSLCYMNPLVVLEILKLPTSNKLEFLLFFSVLFNDTVNVWDYKASVVDKWISMEYWWHDVQRRGLKASENNLSKCHHKSHIKWLGIESVSKWCEAGNKRLTESKKLLCQHEVINCLISILPSLETCELTMMVWRAQHHHVHDDYYHCDHPGQLSVELMLWCYSP